MDVNGTGIIELHVLVCPGLHPTPKVAFQEKKCSQKEKKGRFLLLNPKTAKTPRLFFILYIFNLSLSHSRSTTSPSRIGFLTPGSSTTSLPLILSISEHLRALRALEVDVGVLCCFFFYFTILLLLFIILQKGKIYSNLYAEAYHRKGRKSLLKPIRFYSVIAKKKNGIRCMYAFLIKHKLCFLSNITHFLLHLGLGRHVGCELLPLGLFFEGAQGENPHTHRETLCHAIHIFSCSTSASGP